MRYDICFDISTFLIRHKTFPFVVEEFLFLLSGVDHVHYFNGRIQHIRMNENAIYYFISILL